MAEFGQFTNGFTAKLDPNQWLDENRKTPFVGKVNSVSAYKKH